MFDMALHKAIGSSAQDLDCEMFCTACSNWWHGSKVFLKENTQIKNEEKTKHIIIVLPTEHHCWILRFS